MNLLNLELRRIPVGALLCFGFALFFSLYNWSPLLDAKWSIVDDHEIVSTIGTGDRLPLSEVPVALGKSEVGTAGIATRFRPSYYSLRFLEAATWGKQPHKWYIARIAIAVFFALVLAGVCLRLGGPILTFGFLIFELSRPYWSDIFARLGPAETYAVFGVSLIALGFIVATKKGWRALSCILVALGVVIAAGSKENFIILAVLPLWLLFSPAARLSLGLKSIFGVVLAYLGWILITVVRRLQNAGHDVYANPISIESRIGLLHSLVQRSDVLVWLFVCLLLLVLVHTWRVRDEQMGFLLKSINGYIWAMIVLLGVFASQYVFYYGVWPAGAVPRYMFPGMLAKHFAVFLFFVVVTKIISITPFRLRGVIWGIYLMASLYVLKLSVQDFNANRTASKEMVANSISFTTRLNKAFDFLRVHPSAALILNSNSVLDYEPLFSIERFIRASGLTNPVALKLNGYSSEDYSYSKDPERLAFMLTESLEKIQHFGGRGFIPIRSADAIVECFSMGMSGPPLARCRAGNIIWP